MTLHNSKDDRVISGIDVVLNAVGRSPNTTDIGLETCNIELNNKKQVVVDWKSQKTSSDNIYAIGDMCGRWELTPGTVSTRIF